MTGESKLKKRKESVRRAWAIWRQERRAFLWDIALETSRGADLFFICQSLFEAWEAQRKPQQLRVSKVRSWIGIF